MGLIFSLFGIAAHLFLKGGATMLLGLLLFCALALPILFQGAVLYAVWDRTRGENANIGQLNYWHQLPFQVLFWGYCLPPFPNDEELIVIYVFGGLLIGLISVPLGIWSVRAAKNTGVWPD
ncbi:MAG: hypothetical protein K8R88_02500 [Armatimonadetes bacterium]|nr:hypothetical protein [Armatimonadota bacterium]